MHDITLRVARHSGCRQEYRCVIDGITLKGKVIRTFKLGTKVWRCQFGNEVHPVYDPEWLAYKNEIHLDLAGHPSMKRADAYYAEHPEHKPKLPKPQKQEPTVKELRALCKVKGLTGYSKANKAKLQQMLKAAKPKQKQQKPTVKELRALCKVKGLTGYSKANKAKLQQMLKAA